MAIKINGVELDLTPTEHGWISKERIGVGGDGHPFYHAVQEYEMRWDLVSAEDLNQLSGLLSGTAVTGTAVCELPQYMGASYTYFPYSGCIVHEPEIATYFQEHTTSVRLIISNIRT